MKINIKYLLIAIGLVIGLIFYAGYQFNTAYIELETENELLNFQLEELTSDSERKDSMITANSIFIGELYKQIDSLKIPDEKISASKDTLDVFNIPVSALADSIESRY